MASGKLISVHIVSGDARVLQAARALPEGRFEVRVSAGVRDAERAVQATHFDLAVIDLHPGGFSLARLLKEDSISATTRILMLCERVQDVWLCRQAGAAEVLIKPLTDPAILTEAVDKVLEA